MSSIFSNSSNFLGSSLNSMYHSWQEKLLFELIDGATVNSVILTSLNFLHVLVIAVSISLLITCSPNADKNVLPVQ